MDMKKQFLLFAFAVAATGLFAQKQSYVYAITPSAENMQFLNIRVVNVNSGQVSKTIFEANNNNAVLLSAANNTPATARAEGAGPTGSMVAAAAYDQLHRKLFFIPMRIGELRWADLRQSSSPKYYTLESPVLSKLNYTDEANHFTRMVIGANDQGYALTNDGNHLIHFTTGKKTTITDLGNLVDAAENGSISIHNRCTSWGGDMVAAADGSFYIITQRNHVFQFTAGNRIAKHLGQVKGLPENFTSNGAAVTEDGKVVVSCGYGSQLYYYIDLQNLTAEAAFATVAGNTSASDLASSNLVTRQTNTNHFSVTPTPNSFFVAENQKISMYPNPVTDNRFQIYFETTGKGEHTIQLLDLSGKVLLSKVTDVTGEAQVVGVDMTSSFAKGMYMVKVLNHEMKTVYSGKLMVR
jgi:hypothetical protein